MSAGFGAVRILVLGDQEGMAQDARTRLAADFGNVELAVDASTRLADVGGFDPEVIVFAFASVAAAEACRQALAAAQASRAAGIVLCAATDAARCVALCRQGVFDDYAIVGDGATDAQRLGMSVWNAAKVHAATPAAASPAPRGTRPRVLVVEDDPLAAKLIATTLDSEGLEVSVAGDAAAARASLREGFPSVILMDVNLPGTDGLTFTEALKSNPSLAHIPVIMVTGEAKREVIARSVAIGAAGFIVKPFTRAALLAKLEPLVR